METDEARCRRYETTCRERGVNKASDRCSKECLEHDEEEIEELIEKLTWMKIGPSKWKCETHFVPPPSRVQSKCPRGCVSDKELSYFDMLPPEVIDRISQWEEIAFANDRLKKGMERCHEEMGRLPRCEEHGTVSDFMKWRFYLNMQKCGYRVLVDSDCDVVLCYRSAPKSSSS